MYRPIIETFGRKMPALSIRFYGGYPGVVTREHFLFRIIRAKCPSVAHIIFDHCKIDPRIIIDSVPKLSSLTLRNVLWVDGEWTNGTLPQLKCFSLNRITRCNPSALSHFLQINPQLERLSLEHVVYGMFIDNDLLILKFGIIKSNCYICSANT